jgi:hypothetical protein
VVRDGEPIQTVEPCKETDSAVKLIMFVLLEQLAMEFAAGDLSPNQNNSDIPEALFFLPFMAAEGAFPNVFNAYVSAVVKYQPGRIVVVRGQAPRFPDTRNGVPVTTPQDLRYWSLCNNNHAFPYPVVDCKADFQTARDSQGFYTYIVATPEDIPRTLPPTRP